MRDRIPTYRADAKPLPLIGFVYVMDKTIHPTLGDLRPYLDLKDEVAHQISQRQLKVDVIFRYITHGYGQLHAEMLGLTSENLDCDTFYEFVNSCDALCLAGDLEYLHIDDCLGKSLPNRVAMTLLGDTFTLRVPREEVIVEKTSERTAYATIAGEIQRKIQRTRQGSIYATVQRRAFRRRAKIRSKATRMKG